MSQTFRSDAYIDGKWRAGAKRFPVFNPANQEVIAEVPDLGAAETEEAIEAAHRAFPAWAAKSAKERAAIMRAWFDLMMADLDRLAAADLARRRQADRRSQGRSSVWRELHGMVRRGSEARLRPHHPDHDDDAPLRDDQAADRRVRGDDAVEFPDGDDHAQSRARDRRRQHHRAEAAVTNAADGSGAGGTGRKSRRARRRVQRGDDARAQRRLSAK